MSVTDQVRAHSSARAFRSRSVPRRECADGDASHAVRAEKILLATVALTNVLRETLLVVGRLLECAARANVPRSNLPVSPVSAPPAQVAAPPVVAGWALREGRAYYDGRLVQVGGRRYDVLAILIGRETARTHELRAGWDGYQVEESSVRWQVAELRKTLKALFPEFEGEPIISTTTGYRLVLR
jgi:hypothetical protein